MTNNTTPIDEYFGQRKRNIKQRNNLPETSLGYRKCYLLMLVVLNTHFVSFRLINYENIQFFNGFMLSFNFD